MSRAPAIAALFVVLLIASGARGEPRAVERARAAWSSARGAASKVAARIGDRLSVARGSKAALQRVEHLFDRGEQQRSLRMLDRMLESDRLTGVPLARALLYTETIQTQLGNHGLAARAFAGLVQERPGFELPQGTPDEVQRNFADGRWLAYSSATLSYLNTAKQPGELSLANRLVYSGREVKARVQEAIRARPPLMSVYGNTIGRYTVWRALNALERQGVPRFRVQLVPDAADPWGGLAHRNGRVTLDVSTTLSYSATVAALAHEAWHLNQPIALSPEGIRITEQAFNAQRSIAELRAQGRETPRAERAARQAIARKLREQRGILWILGREIEKLGVREEGLADRFSGRMLTQENLPVTHQGWGILGRTPDALHPKPRQAFRQFKAGVNDTLSEMVSIDKSRQAPPPSKTQQPPR